MADWIELPSTAQASLLRTLESARPVTHRGDYFLWLQGHFNALVPHGVLLVLQLDGQGKVLSEDCLQSVVFEADRQKALCVAPQGLLLRMAQWGRQQGLGQLSIPPSADDDACPLALCEEWAALGEPQAQLLWVHDVSPGQCLCFAFLRLNHALLPWQKSALSLLSPQLLVGYLRSVAHESKHAQSRDSVVIPQSDDLTDRQLEILHWVKMGKTNGEIAQIIGISDLTVKNHLQKVFRRLNVHNRAQAVALLVSQRKV